MKYVYPAIFTEDENGVYVEFPDLPGCFTDGKDMVEAIENARDAAAMWLTLAEDRKEEVPKRSTRLEPESGIVSLVDIDTLEYRKETDNRAVKKTLSIPSWLNYLAEQSDVNFSGVLQNALKKELKLN